jgi:hypothetical protein
MQEKLQNFGFSVDKEDNENGLYKTLDGKFMLCYYSNPNDNLVFVGFWSDGKLKGNVRKTLEEALVVLPEEYFGESTGWDEPQNWLVKRFYIGKYKKPLADIVDYLIGRYKLLEERIRELPQ